MKPRFPLRVFLIAAFVLSIYPGYVAVMMGYYDQPYSPSSLSTEPLQFPEATRMAHARVNFALWWPLSVLVAFLALSSLRAAWYFLLGRLSEISNAVKHPNV